jgi:hypothetical protein
MDPEEACRLFSLDTRELLTGLSAHMGEFKGKMVRDGLLKKLCQQGTPQQEQEDGEEVDDGSSVVGK